MYPVYLESYNNGRLKRIAEKTFKMLESCCICPRKCKVNRLNNKKGFCRIGLKPVVYSFMPHHGEEPPISGSRGSGAIFFSGCNMACIYCQNYEFSQLDKGREVEFEELANIILQLQEMGCHNINLVTPTHIMPHILKSLTIAIPKGLKIPIVYNTSGYELPQIIKLLDAVVDIYLPDMRYAENNMGLKYSSAPDYPEFNQASLQEMQRQVGIAKFDAEGVIKKGVIIRHLVLPNDISGTDRIMKFIAEKVSKDTYISLMSQYSPYYKANQFKDIARRISYQEYEYAKSVMHKYGLYNGWTQDEGGLEKFAGVNIKPVWEKGQNDT